MEWNSLHQADMDPDVTSDYHTWQVAEFFGVQSQTVERWCRSAERRARLGAYRSYRGTGWRFKLDVVRSLMAELERFPLREEDGDAGQA